LEHTLRRFLRFHFCLNMVLSPIAEIDDIVKEICILILHLSYYEDKSI
jgi:hypothetical protein